jgi:predicted transcriptional regulator
MVIIDEEDYLAHYGILRRSGRYPWNSGGNENAPQDTVNRSFLETIKSMLGMGMTEKEVADAFEISTTDLRSAKAIAKAEVRQSDIGMAQRLKEKGFSNIAIGERMGIGESQVRNLLAPGAADKASVLENTRDILKKNVDEKKYLDVGSGVENYLDVSDTRLNTAVAMLKEEGYKVHHLRVTQLGTGKETSLKVLAGPDSTWSEVYANRDKLRQIQDWSDDGGRTMFGIKTPLNLDSSRVAVKYGSEGGAEADGVMYIRPGVEDLDLGGSRYAQVRVAVDGTHYLKGMAMYKTDLPDGVDVVFNTNKESTGNKLDAMKKLSDDPDNPFGAELRRQIQNDKGEVTSVMNLVNEEGDWGDWSKSISAQALSKQSPQLVKEQLGITYDRKKNEFDAIMALDNPTVRKKLLEDFADSADASAVHLKAAALPRQKWQVILPVTELKDTEVYAPGFKDGEPVALIRYPHGGKFEIPILTVNNRQPKAKAALGDAKDAIGINPKVAERLSGADFDGDTVLVIPNREGRIQSDPALRELKGFDPRASYPAYEGMPKMKPATKQREMGDVSNLITDMTIQGASSSELARAVKHSMVVIDAEKHNLNYKESAKVNGIRALKEKYQGGARGGASTLISNSGKNATIRIPDRKPRPYSEGGPIDAATGKRMFVDKDETYTNAKGETVVRTTKVPKLDYVDDVSVYNSKLNTPVERAYSDHANKMKALGNQARKELISTPRLKYSPSAKRTYAAEVARLDASLALAVKNRPRERQAQVLANAIVRQKLDANPNMDPDHIKRIKNQALTEARTRVGAKKPQIEITPREWEAIQAGAISDSKLREILDNTDIEQVKEFATPKAKTSLSPAKASRAQDLVDRGYTRAEVAQTLGISIGTLDEALYGGEE